MIKVYQVNDKPLSIQEIIKESGFKIKEKEMWDRLYVCECGSNEWILLPKNHPSVLEGGKRYMICSSCFSSSHL